MARRRQKDKKLEVGSRIHHWRWGSGVIMAMYEGLLVPIAIVRFDEHDATGKRHQDCPLDSLTPVRRRGLLRREEVPS